MNSGSLLYRNDPDQYLRNVRADAAREVSKLDANGDGKFSQPEIKQGIKQMAKVQFVIEQNTLSTTFLLGSASKEEVRVVHACRCFPSGGVSAGIRCLKGPHLQELRRGRGHFR